MSHLTEEQRKAANPECSAWVQANAGTGKTKLLVSRLLQILFRTENRLFQSILCLTYTKAGASEMRNRITQGLKEWSLANDDELRELLFDVVKKNPATSEDLAKARAIFYEYIDNPDMLKVKTIHSFCEEILRRFPTEAGLSPSWDIMTDVTKKVLQNEAFDRMFLNANDTTKDAFEHVMSVLPESNFNKLKDDILDNYQIFLDVDDVEKYRKYFVEMIAKKIDFQDTTKFDPDKNMLRKILQMCENVQQNEYKLFEKYKKSLASFLDGEVEYTVYQSAALNGNFKKSVKKNFPFLLDELVRVEKFKLISLSRTLIKDTLAVFDLTCEFTKEYEELKHQYNMLDFDDLIIYTDKLFSNQETMGWVLSQMDFSLSHILVDEAQDTGTKQWGVLNKLIDDFFTDGDTSDCPRTVLVVGDTKQAIYGFQDANPQVFDESRKMFFERLHNNNRMIEKNTNLTLSFRSAKPVLQAVDTFFDSEKIRNLTKFTNNTHKCKDESVKGCVEIYKLVCKEGMNETADVIKKRYISNICKQIKTLITDKKYKASDIMVLLRNREPLGTRIATELHKQGVPIAGADKIKLPTFPVIVDLLNLVRFCIDNTDDYSLCCVLKSPLFAMNDTKVYEICEMRNKDWYSQKKEAESQGKYAPKPAIYPYLQPMYLEVYNELQDFIKRIKVDGPYTFFSYVLNHHNNRENMVAALGSQILEPLEEFMTLCLAYERTQPGTLKHFLKWFVTSSSEVKRELNNTEIEGVRILTVHGSKGLEAPVVFLIDTMTTADEKERILNFPHEKTTKYPLWVWRRSKSVYAEIESISSASEILRQQAIEESYRLLYVAMTRSKYELYIYGYQSSEAKFEQMQWHTLLWNVFSESTEPFVHKNEDKIRISNADE